MSGASMTTVGAGLLVLVLNVGFWSYLCYAVANKEQASATLLGQLLGIWVVLVIVVPTTGRLFIQYAVPVPSGANIQMTQREAVNDAWDLPKEVTMQAFVERHPEWRPYADVTQPFEWKWYYAFQQVGDQTAEPLSRAYMEGRSSRDQWGWVVAALSPPALFERVYQTLAETDMASQLAYEERVRQFHKRLRHFYYPRLFLGETFDSEQIVHTPLFQQ